MSGRAASLDTFPSTMARAWRWIRRLFWAGMAVATVVVLLQVVQLYTLLAGVSPWLARGAAGALALVLLGGGAWLFLGYVRTPRVLLPPELPDPGAGWTPEQGRAYRDFAVRYLRRQARNPHLDDEARARIPGAVERLGAALPPAAGADPVRDAAALAAAVERELGAILAPLDREANRLIRRAAVEVSLATAVSPSVLLDGLIALARNLDLIARIASLYYGRPGALGTLRVVRDVFGSAVTAGALEVLTDNLSGALTEMTGSWSARLVGPLGQGLVNGIVTMRLGAAARHRCRSLRGRTIPWAPWRLATYRRAAGALLDWLSADAGPWILGPFGRAARWVDRTARATAEGGATLVGAVKERILPGRARRSAGDAAAAVPGDPVLEGGLLEQT